MINLKEKFNLTFVDPNNPMGGVKYNAKVFGDVYIGDGIIFIESCNMIWDRNMLLMFKDTATARFHTLFANEHRTKKT